MIINNKVTYIDKDSDQAYIIVNFPDAILPLNYPLDKYAAESKAQIFAVEVKNKVYIRLIRRNTDEPSR